VICLPYSGVILHHSVCSSINGKGYDFFITEQAGIIPASFRTDPNYIHICLEGNFGNVIPAAIAVDRKLQLFVLHKLLLRLSARFDFPATQVFPHSPTCPGKLFPWGELVISATDGYH
jgi:hypothetical protein